MFPQKIVTPVEPGVQESFAYLKKLDSGFRRNDGKRKIQTFYEIIKFAWVDKKISQRDDGFLSPYDS